jgi:SAM-dependent methyltransferase
MRDVHDYYEANTRKFLLFGAEGAIHRELWAPGITSKAAALHHAHDLVLRELLAVSSRGHARVLDLGCGVGAATRFLAGRVPARLYGVSLSGRQVALAQRWPSGESLLGQCSFHEADFCSLPAHLSAELRPIDLAFGIESFVHAGSAHAFFREASSVLRPGGRLVLVDDFVASTDGPLTLLEDVRSGWHMHSLLTMASVAAAAESQGLFLADSVDLSSFQRLGRPRDKLVRAFQPALRRVRRYSLWAQSLVGGDALQRCHRRGLLKYRLVRFEKRLA